MSPPKLYVFTENYNVFKAFAKWYEVCLSARCFRADVCALLLVKHRIVILDNILTSYSTIFV